ncbi:MAG TPA: DHA2 family efflux MFS transporter permease subunit [Prolixibacteraceae bacterium]|nr:DHA2 family efflux MFS transporter permease subunit [Prolixibacteraceae bacterium]
MQRLTLSHRFRRKIRNRDSGYHPQNDNYKWFVLANIMLGTFMAVLDSTIVNVGLPKIMASFGVGIDKIAWVITAYMLSMAVMLPTSGWLADKFGYKRLYFLGLLMFTIGSMLCGMSNDENTLILARIVQGLGAGTIQPLGMAIITREFPPHQRGVALGFWAISAAASVSFGPLIGGYLVDNFSWQLIFDVNIPFGIAAMVFTILIQKEYFNPRVGKFDLIGFISVITFFPVLLYALSEGSASSNSAGWGAPYILICFAVSMIAFAVFITQELTCENPLIDLKLLGNYNFGMGNIVMLIFSMGMFGSTFLLPLYLQNSMGYTAVQAGSVFLPVGIIQGIMSPIAGKISDKFSPKAPMILGIIILGISFLLNSQLTYLSEHSFVMTSLYLRGFALGIIFTPLSTLSLLTVPREKMAQASGISNTVRQLGGSLGVAIFTTMLTTRVNFHTQMFGQAIQAGSQEFKNVIANLALFAQQHMGSNMANAAVQGKSMLMSHIMKQAYIAGIDDDFYMAAVFTFVGLIPVIIMRTKKPTIKKA